MRFKAPRGTHDILPDEVARWQHFETVARDQMRRYGFREIRTPILEKFALFERGTGETTDVVQKEMYSFTKSDTVYSLRPEGTPSVVRAYLEANLDKVQPLQKFYYIGPMFRYERPQAGRQRQFHQLGVEVIGSDSPLHDAEIIALAFSIFEGIGLTGHRLIVNSSGCRDCRPAYRDTLHETLGPQIESMCHDCNTRYERNVLRILDCKKEPCRNVVATLPKIEAHLCDACHDHFSRLKAALTGTGLPYEINPYLVRGLDYYTRTVFEIHHSALGARGAICGGGRYDNMVEQFGGPALGCTGFSMGMEATLAVLTDDTHASAAPDLCLIPMGAAAEQRCFEWAFYLRGKGYYADITYGSKSVKAKMRAANKTGSRYVAVVGDQELDAGTLTVKQMETGEQTEVAFDEGLSVLERLLAPVRNAPSAKTEGG